MVDVVFRFSRDQLRDLILQQMAEQTRGSAR
jgi:hypothetical protein